MASKDNNRSRSSSVVWPNVGANSQEAPHPGGAIYEPGTKETFLINSLFSTDYLPEAIYVYPPVGRIVCQIYLDMNARFIIRFKLMRNE